MKSPKRSRIMVLLDAQTMTEFDKAAADERRSRSSMGEKIIVDWLKRNAIRADLKGARQES